MRLIDHARELASKCLTPLALRAAKAYVAGERLDDALAVADRLAERGIGTTLGYWDEDHEPPELVAEAYLAGIHSLAGREHAYMSIKLPSLKYSTELMGRLVDQARRHRVRLHFDAMAPETADATREFYDRFADCGAELSYTLPARWRRSLDDARWACERGMIVRVVKGQWPDPDEPGRDMHEGYRQLIEVLAGRARHVAVATHDVVLAMQSIRRLQAAKTSCGMELLYGLPMPRSLEAADRLAVGVHVYVPYGRAYLPYALSKVRANPRIAWWLLRDLVLARKSNQPLQEAESEPAAR